MAVTDLSQVSARMKDLRKATGLKQHEVAQKLGEPPRTFQSWENGEVETDRANYKRVAAFYSRRLKPRKVTANWILFGQDEAPPETKENGKTPDLSVVLGEPANVIDLEDVRAQLDRIEADQRKILAFVRADVDAAAQAEITAAVDEELQKVRDEHARRSAARKRRAGDL
jgi:transcriptional regulator with XRE-family HTH domain